MHAPADPPARTLLVITPWKRRWELGGGAGLADDDHFIRGFTAHGWRVHYVSPRDAAPPDVSADGYRVHAFYNFFQSTARWPTWLRRAVWPAAFTLLATARALRAARADRPHVILGQTHISSFAVFLVSMVCGVPSVMKLFGVDELGRVDESQMRHVRRNAEMLAALRIPHDLWIVLDDGTGGDEALRRHGVPSDRIRFLPNGVDLAWADSRADGGAFRSLHGIPADVPVVLWLARHIDWKRGDDALRAFARASAMSARPMMLVVGGDGSDRAYLERLAQQLGAAERVRFPGAIAHRDVPGAMAAASLFLATAERSNKSIATCEALLCGVPVVAYDVGGTSHVVREGETGRLVAFDDVDGLAAAIVALLDDDDARRAMGEGARAFARARFTDWEQRIEMERVLIERLAGSGAERE